MALTDIDKQAVQITDEDRALIKVIEHGLPIVSRPYQVIAEHLGTTEEKVISHLQHLINSGAIKRYGVVVRHRELGYLANGMVVWDVPDDQVSRLGHCIGKFSCVTLSYRRPRRLPDWPYNLFTMVHGHDREEVKQRVQEIVETCGLHDYEYDILFSTRRFKQRGAQYSKSQHLQQASKKSNVQLQLVKAADPDA